MKRTLLAAGMVLGLADAGPAKAQFIVGGVCPPAFGGGFVAGGGFGFSYQRAGFRVAGFGGGFYSRSVFVAPSFPVFPPLVPFSSFAVFPPVSQWTPWGWTPGFIQAGWGVGPGWGLGPWWGVGPGWGWWGAPPPVFAAPPIILAGNIGGNLNGNAVAAGGIPGRRDPDPMPPGDFVVISPRKDGLNKDTTEVGTITPNLTRVAAIRPPIPRSIPFDPFAAPRVTVIDKPDPDPLKESARLTKLGREAFAAGEYGQAAEQFDRAAAADPKATTPLFLKAQALFAAGQYADAVAAIRAGLDLDPTWPAGTFDPKEPYGLNPAAFAEHLAGLRRIVAANPGEPTLEFLLGYQLWFIGEKAEAKKWFDAAAKRLAVPGPIALFK